MIYDLSTITDALQWSKNLLQNTRFGNLTTDVLTYVFSCKQKASHFTGYIIRNQLPYVNTGKLWGLITYNF
jgi:hypothetical protein